MFRILDRGMLGEQPRCGRSFSFLISQRTPGLADLLTIQKETPFDPKARSNFPPTKVFSTVSSLPRRLVHLYLCIADLEIPYQSGKVLRRRNSFFIYVVRRLSLAAFLPLQLRTIYQRLRMLQPVKYFLLRASELL